MIVLYNKTFTHPKLMSQNILVCDKCKNSELTIMLKQGKNSLNIKMIMTLNYYNFINKFLIV